MNRNIVIALVVGLVILLGVVFVMNSQNSGQTQQTGQSQITETPNTAPTVAVSPTETEDASGSGDAMEGSVKAFTVESNGLSFTPNKLTVKAGDKVTITYKNNVETHNLVIDEFSVKTKLLNAGQQESLEFVAAKKGVYEFYCAVPGHRQSGMVGTLTVE